MKSFIIMHWVLVSSAQENVFWFKNWKYAYVLTCKEVQLFNMLSLVSRIVHYAAVQSIFKSCWAKARSCF